MGRTHDMILPADTPWLADARSRRICSMLEQGGYQALYVGGCVRNAVLNEKLSDVDFATDARPESVMALAEKAGIHAVPTGIDHGTVTLVVGKAAFEVTTFRRDIETDGRRAVVTFSTRIEDDARRRDFTMNALYARSDGTVVDPLSGLSDTLARRVRFIDSAAERIAEDYLRILRFFRFSACYADPEHGIEAETLAAIAANLDGLERLSAERIGAELMKLLMAADPAEAVAAMVHVGVFARILPLKTPAGLGPLILAEQASHSTPDSIRRLASLNPDDAANRLRLSKKNATDLDRLIMARDGTLPPRALGYELGDARGWDAFLLRAAALGHPVDTCQKEAVSEGACATFPVRSSDLRPAYSGPELGRKLHDLKARWLASDLSLDRSALLG